MPLQNRQGEFLWCESSGHIVNLSGDILIVRAGLSGLEEMILEYQLGLTNTHALYQPKVTLIGSLHFSKAVG